MDRIVLMNLRKNPKYYNYFLKNSMYLKVLNRNLNGYKDFKKIIDNKYGLTSYDRINKFVDKANAISMLIDSVK